MVSTTRKVKRPLAVLFVLAVLSAGVEGLSGFAFVPYGQMPESSPARVPSGCAEFSVDLPRPHGGPVVRAADYGFSEASTDNVAAINRALAAARRLGAARRDKGQSLFT